MLKRPLSVIDHRHLRVRLIACLDELVIPVRTAWPSRQVPRLSFTFFCNVHGSMHNSRNRDNFVLDPVNDTILMKEDLPETVAFKFRDDPAKLRECADLFN